MLFPSPSFHSNGGWASGATPVPSDDVPELIRALTELVDAHGQEWDCLGGQGREDERLDYDLLPGFADGFNSNSFIAGILEVVGVDADGVEPDPVVPGYAKPVVAERFSLDDPGTCQ